MSQAGFDPMIPVHYPKLCVMTDKKKYNVQLYSVYCVIKYNKKATIQHLHLVSSQTLISNANVCCTEDIFMWEQ